MRVNCTVMNLKDQQNLFKNNIILNDVVTDYSWADIQILEMMLIKIRINTSMIKQALYGNTFKIIISETLKKKKKLQVYSKCKTLYKL